MNVKERVVDIEIVLSVLLASSMILLLMHPPTGQLLCMISVALLILFYIILCFNHFISYKRENSRLVLDGINYLVAAISMILIFINSAFLKTSFIPGVLAVVLLIVLFVLNLSNMNHYGIRDENYSTKQTRIVVLCALTLMLIFIGKSLYLL